MNARCDLLRALGCVGRVDHEYYSGISGFLAGAAQSFQAVSVSRPLCGDQVERNIHLGIAARRCIIQLLPAHRFSSGDHVFRRGLSETTRRTVVKEDAHGRKATVAGQWGL